MFVDLVEHCHNRASMRGTFLALAITVSVLVAACGDDGGAGPVDPSAETAEVSPSPTASPTAVPSVDPEGALCRHVAEMERRLASLRSVELSLPNRVALDIELEKLTSAYDELDDLSLGARALELERSLTRLGYRLTELELAVEDFRTNTRPRRAASHVEQDSERVAEELGAFAILSRC